MKTILLVYLIFMKNYESECFNGKILQCPKTQNYPIYPITDAINYLTILPHYLSLYLLHLPHYSPHLPHYLPDFLFIPLLPPLTSLFISFIHLTYLIIHLFFLCTPVYCLPHYLSFYPIIFPFVPWQWPKNCVFEHFWACSFSLNTSFLEKPGKLIEKYFAKYCPKNRRLSHYWYHYLCHYVTTLFVPLFILLFTYFFLFIPLLSLLFIPLFTVLFVPVIILFTSLFSNYFPFVPLKWGKNGFLNFLKKTKIYTKILQYIAQETSLLQLSHYWPHLQKW